MGYKRYNLKGGTVTKDSFIYVDEDGLTNWKYFFSGDPTPDTGGAVDRVSQVKSHTVNEGPGNALYPNTRFTRREHTRRSWSMPSWKGSARPGITIHVGEPDPLNADQWRERRQFAYKGALIDLINYAKNKAKFELVITSEAGRNYLIEGATAP